MEIVKQLHIFAALLSITGFALRGFWMIQGSPVLQHRVVKTLPHINDTLLLGTAITLAMLTHQYPGQASWLTAKVSALLVYIGLGMVALRFGKTKKVRIFSWLLAILVFAYIVGVAITKNTLVTFG